ncbi:unnamed protein product, partial [Amoebophrya sp. A25]
TLNLDGTRDNTHHTGGEAADGITGPPSTSRTRPRSEEIGDDNRVLRLRVRNTFLEVHDHASRDPPQHRRRAVSLPPMTGVATWSIPTPGSGTTGAAAGAQPGARNCSELQPASFILLHSMFDEVRSWVSLDNGSAGQRKAVTTMDLLLHLNLPSWWELHAVPRGRVEALLGDGDPSTGEGLEVKWSKEPPPAEVVVRQGLDSLLPQDSFLAYHDATRLPEGFERPWPPAAARSSADRVRGLADRAYSSRGNLFSCGHNIGEAGESGRASNDRHNEHGSTFTREGFAYQRDALPCDSAVSGIAEHGEVYIF